jgi:hypothetical protein
VPGTSVVIADNHGYSETLAEGTPGHFYTNSIQGIIGNSYTITVKTGDGNIYKSTAQKLLPVGDFNIKYELKLNEDPFANLQITSTNGFKVTVDSEVLPGQEGRVWWRVTGTYHIFTYAYFRLKPAPAGVGWVPDPPPCSGYIPFGNVGYLKPTYGFDGIRYKEPCTCCNCWTEEYNQVPLISNLKFVNNGQINDFPVGFIEINRRTFYDKYYMEIEQLSLSQEVYDFWKKVQIQKSSSSNLFQTPPPKVGSNLIASTPNAPTAIGYFAASSIKRQALILDKSNVPYHLFDIDTIPQSCLDTYRISLTIRNSSNQKPVFW